MRRLLVSVLVLWSGVPSLAAQEPRDTLPADTAIALEGVVVKGVRAVTTAGGTSAIVVRPDSLRLAPAPTLEQVLRQIPFVQVRENSRGEAQLSVRGAESRQVAVLVDGVPLTLGWDNRTDLSLVPVTGARSVLLVRGLSSVLHGPNVLGGVVEVGLGHGPERMQPPHPFQLRAGIDHVGAHSLAAGGGTLLDLGAGDLLLRAGVGYRSRPGFTLPSGIADTDARNGRLRGNSDSEHADGFLSLRYQGLAGQWLSLAASGYHAERGVPPELHVAQPRFWRYPRAARGLTVVSGGTGQRRTPVGEGDLEASLGFDVGHTQINSYGTPAYTEVTDRELTDDRTLTLRLLGDHTLGRRGELRGAVTLAEVLHDETLDPGGSFRYRQRLWSLGAEVAWPVGEGTRVSGGWAVDGADTPESGDKPPLDRLWAWGARLGASMLTLDGRLRLHAAASRRSRFPSLRELYSGALGRFVPNPELRSEALLGAEVGATATVGPWELQTVLFRHRLSDAIVRASTGDGRFRRENRDRIHSTGVEVMGEWSGPRVSLSSHLTLQRIRIIDPAEPEGERQAEYQPEVMGGLDLSVPLLLGVRGAVRAEYVGRQWCVHPDVGRDVALDPSARLDLQLERGWRLPGTGGLLQTARASLALDNVTDALVFDQCGLPQPGRTLRVQLELR